MQNSVHCRQESQADEKCQCYQKPRIVAYCTSWLVPSFKYVIDSHSLDDKRKRSEDELICTADIVISSLQDILHREFCNDNLNSTDRYDPTCTCYRHVCHDYLGNWRGPLSLFNLGIVVNLR